MWRDVFVAKTRRKPVGELFGNAVTCKKNEKKNKSFTIPDGKVRPKRGKRSKTFRIDKKIILRCYRDGPPSLSKAVGTTLFRGFVPNQHVDSTCFSGILYSHPASRGRLDPRNDRAQETVTETRTMQTRVQMGFFLKGLSPPPPTFLSSFIYTYMLLRCDERITPPSHFFVFCVRSRYRVNLWWAQSGRDRLFE